MARSRNLKPSFFTDAELVECEFWERLLFAGLWTVADRDGRLIDRPKQIKLDLFPADDVDIAAGLTNLERHGLIRRYTSDVGSIIQITNFARHQNPHRDERASTLPAEPISGEHHANTVPTQYPHSANRADSLVLIPDSLSLIPDSQSLEPDSGFLKPITQDSANADVSPPAVIPLETPYAIWQVFCAAAGYDITAATPQEKGKSLKCAQRLIVAGVTGEDVAACTRWLTSQSWRTGVLSLNSVEAEIGKWAMAGKPTHEQPRRQNARGDMTSVGLLQRASELRKQETQ